MQTTAKYGLLGHPLGHSFSRGFHTERFARLGIDAVYENFDLPDLAELPAVLAREPQLRGLNVTIPYKQAVMAYLDELDPLAERIGAVNVVRVERRADGSVRLTGHNSDIVGFRDSIRPLLGPSHRRALLLGTGGASKAVRVALEDLGIACTYVSRRRQETPCGTALTYDELTPEVMAAHTVVVNCSPVGMFPHVDECPAIPYDALTPQHVCYDVIYNPDPTLFMRRAAERGATVKGGREMLEGQAIESYRLWTEG